MINKLKLTPRPTEVEPLSVVPEYDLLVFIGRFQPLHKGHQVVIDKALQLAKHVLLIVGSKGKARSTRNPFTYEERAEMVRLVYPQEQLIIDGVSDAAYNDTEWVAQVQKIVKKHALKVANPNGFSACGLADIKVGLIGHEKDHSSYYLKLFPQWGNVGVQHVSTVNATAIRDMLFDGKFNRWEIDAIVEDEITKYILAFKVTAEFDRLKKEHEFIKKYRKDWGDGPHLTADAVVEIGGNVLLIKRGKEYGHGLFALPGGFLEKNERFLDGALRELREETRLKVPAPVLKGSIKKSAVFDDPHRSQRGRVITEAFHIRLENDVKLPEVRGSDDAEWAGFRQISDIVDGTLTEKMFFEDHYHIIRKMLGV
jgi:bifunctional NMN adenylyltransferase/nudix hydrolase